MLVTLYQQAHEVVVVITIVNQSTCRTACPTHPHRDLLPLLTVDDSMAAAASSHSSTGAVIVIHNENQTVSLVQPGTTIVFIVCLCWVIEIDSKEVVSGYRAGEDAGGPAPSSSYSRDHMGVLDDLI